MINLGRYTRKQRCDNLNFLRVPAPSGTLFPGLYAVTTYILESWETFRSGCLVSARMRSHDLPFTS